MRIIIGKLVQISAATRNSGSKYCNQRADAALTDEHRLELEAHFRFTLAIGLRDAEPHGNRLTTEELIQKASYVDELTAVQKRLVHANILRQNRIEFAKAWPEKMSENKDDDLRVLASAEMAQPEKQNDLDAKTATVDLKTTMAKATLSVTTKVTQTAEMQDYPQRPTSERNRMVQCPYCGDSLSPEDLKSDSRWR